MKAKDFIKSLQEHDTEAEIYCGNSHGYAVPADFMLVIFPSKAVFMVVPESKAKRIEREFERKFAKKRKV